MRQTISTTDFDNLTEQSRHRLMEWMVEHHYGDFMHPTIGQMIEFLDNAGTELTKKPMTTDDEPLRSLLTLRSDLPRWPDLIPRHHGLAPTTTLEGLFRDERTTLRCEVW